MFNFSELLSCAPANIKMSLALVQGYSSEEEALPKFLSDNDEDASEEVEVTEVPPPLEPRKPHQFVPPARTSILPTAFELFTEVTGPPEFLKNSVAYLPPSRPKGESLPSKTSLERKSHQERRPSSAVRSRGVMKGHAGHLVTPILDGAAVVVEAKAQVFKDTTIAPLEVIRRAPAAGLPPAEDAADLLRMCLKCGVPKTYSGAKEAMVCPLCGDRPAAVADGNIPDKKRGNKVKDKEHSKRMKGQSTHASWKSETEMHLRQQFD